MDCREMRELIVQHSSGDLGQPEIEEVESHITECAECAVYYRRSQILWELLDGIEEIEPEENYIGRFWDKVDKQKIEENSGVVGWIKTIKLNWAFAGAFATICIVSIFTFAIIQDDFKSDSFTKTDIQDERILKDLDMAISRDTSDVLAIYGPWENANIDNSGGMN